MSKSILITGANRGIGYHIANNILSDSSCQFGLVILACRDPSLAEQAVKKMEQDYQSEQQKDGQNDQNEGSKETSLLFGSERVKYVAIDLLGDGAGKTEEFSSVASQVRKLCSDFKSSSSLNQGGSKSELSASPSLLLLDAVVHNAGYGFLIDNEADATCQQLLEHATQTVQVNFTNTVKLNESLMPLLRPITNLNEKKEASSSHCCGGGRVVVVGSKAGLLHCFPDVSTAPLLLQHLLLFSTSPVVPSSTPPAPSQNNLRDGHQNLEALLAIGEQYLNNIKEGRTVVKGGMPAVFPLTTKTTTSENEKENTTASVSMSSWPSSPYCMSKILIHAYVRLLALSSTSSSSGGGVHVSVCTPGYCQTSMTLGAGYRTALEGAADPTWLSTAPLNEVEKLHGQFIADKQPVSYVQ